jgi:hypothetical protein
LRALPHLFHYSFYRQSIILVYSPLNQSLVECIPHCLLVIQFKTITNNLSMQEASSVQQAKKCFTSIQSRRVWSPVVTNTCSLCPSMDLMVFGLQQQQQAGSDNKTAADNEHGSERASSMENPVVQPATSTLWLHRTVTWQKLSTLAPAATAASADESLSLPSSSMGETDEALVATTWRPDGRILATASKHRVTLYNVEDVSPPSGSMFMFLYIFLCMVF